MAVTLYQPTYPVPIEGMRIRLERDYRSMSYNLVILFYLHAEPTSMVEPIPEVFIDIPRYRTTAEAIYNDQTLQHWCMSIAYKYFHSTMTPDDRELRIKLATAILYTIKGLQRREEYSPPTPEPPKPKLDPDMQSAIDLADEGMKLQQEILTKTAAYQKKVKAHKKKYGSITDLFK